MSAEVCAHLVEVDWNGWHTMIHSSFEGMHFPQNFRTQGLLIKCVLECHTFKLIWQWHQRIWIFRMYGRFDFQTIFYLFIQNWSQAKCISFFDFIFSFYLHDQKILIVSMVLFFFIFCFFCFFFQKLIFVPVIHVKTMEHVKTSVHITHAPVLLDFKVSTVRQVKKLDEQTTNIETKLL